MNIDNCEVCDEVDFLVPVVIERETGRYCSNCAFLTGREVIDAR